MRMEKVRDMTCALQTLEPCVYAMSARHARKMCQQNVRATRSVYKCMYMYEGVCVCFVLVCMLRRSTSILISPTKTLSTTLLSNDHRERMLLGFPRHALLLIFGDAIVWNLNLRFGSPRSTIPNCESHISQSSFSGSRSSR